MLGLPPPAAAATFAAPNWLNAQPGLEPLPWPSSPHRFPVEDYYGDLLAAISPTPEEDRAVRAWLPVVRERLTNALRPHALDVDVLECGSFATGTHLTSPMFDVDLVARLHTLDATADSPAALLERIRGWVAYGVDADIVVTGGTIVIADKAVGTAGLRVRVIPCASRGGTVRPIARLEDDPLAHRDLVLARDRALGGDSVMRRAIRIAKHVNALQPDHASPPVTSHDIESLALATLTCPATLGDAVAALLKSVATLIRDRPELVHRRRPVSTPATFAAAAEAADQAMGTLDRQVVFDHMNPVFAPASTDSRPAHA